VDGAGEDLALGEHGESVDKVGYVVLGGFFICEQRLVALSYISHS